MSVLTKWLDELMREMTRVGVDPAEQRRLVRELRDHWEDCRLENVNQISQGSAQMATDQLGNSVVDSLSTRMGSAQSVARAAKEQGPRRPFGQRHPLLVCLAIPIPLMLAVAVSYTALVVAVLSVWKPAPSSALAPYLLPALFLGVLFIPSAASAALLAWFAVRHDIKKRWLVVGVLPLALLASHITMVYRLPDQPGNGNLSLGANLSPSLGNIPQLMVPLAAATAVAWWFHRRQTRRTTADET